MTVALQQGQDFTATYASSQFPTLSDDWAAKIDIYADYPNGSSLFTKNMVRNVNEFDLLILGVELASLLVGPYSFVSTFVNSVTGITIITLDTANVSPLRISTEPMCKIFGTVIKPDGTAAGQAVITPANPFLGTPEVVNWIGVVVTAAVTPAAANNSDVVDIETISTITNKLGYFEIYVIEGLTAKLTCPVFGETVTVVTTGHTTIDISTLI